MKFWGFSSLIFYCASFFFPSFASAKYLEAIIDAPGPSGKLMGSLVQTERKSVAAAIIIPGSGPTDFDGNGPGGLNPATYKLLAHDLASAGISSLRIDKRGMFRSESAVLNPNDVTIGDYVSDIDVWIASLKKRLGITCIWLIGHSEGSLVALAAANKLQGVCGVVSLAGSGVSFGTLLRQQIKSNPANIALIDSVDFVIGELEARRTVITSNLHHALQNIFAPEIQGFLIDLFSYDPKELASRLSVPLLIVQGGRDLQVPVENGYSLKAAQMKAKLAIFPNANHVLKEVASRDYEINIGTYLDPNLPLATGLSAEISNFILRNPRGKPASQ